MQKSLDPFEQRIDGLGYAEEGSRMAQQSYMKKTNRLLSSMPWLGDWIEHVRSIFENLIGVFMEEHDERYFQTS